MGKMDVKLAPEQKKKWEKPYLVCLDIKRTENGIGDEADDQYTFAS